VILGGGKKRSPKTMEKEVAELNKKGHTEVTVENGKR
jgi:hypothetical protein